MLMTCSTIQPHTLCTAGPTKMLVFRWLNFFTLFMLVFSENACTSHSIFILAKQIIIYDSCLSLLRCYLTELLDFAWTQMLVPFEFCIPNDQFTDSASLNRTVISNDTDLVVPILQPAANQLHICSTICPPSKRIVIRGPKSVPSPCLHAILISAEQSWAATYAPIQLAKLWTKIGLRLILF